MNRVEKERFSRRGGQGRLTAFWFAGTFLWCLCPSLLAQGSSDGFNRITRSDVNSGSTFKAQDDFGFLQGSVGAIDVRVSSDGEQSLLGGIQGNLYYPTTPSSFKWTSVSSSTIHVNWRAPGAGIDSNQLVGKYQLRRRTDPITQDNFDASTDISADFSTMGVGSFQPSDIPISELEYNTIYYIGLAALDSEGNRSYLATTSTCTLAPEVTDFTYETNEVSKTVEVTFNPHNNKASPDSLTYKYQISKKGDFFSEVFNGELTSSASISVTTPPLPANNKRVPWYFRVKVINSQGAATPWYPTGSFRIDYKNPYPSSVTINPNEVYVTSATLRWVTSGLPSGYLYQAQASLDDFVSHTDSGLVTKTTNFYKFSDLLPNRIYKFRVAVIDDGDVIGSVNAPDSRVTSVYPVTGVTVPTVSESGASVQWTDDFVLNGTNPHSYKVEVSSESPSTGFRTLSPTVNYPVTTPFPLTDLPVNTTHYVRVKVFNSSGDESVLGPSDVIVFHTKARSPGPIGFTELREGESSRISFYWDDNGNNPLSQYQVALSRDEGFGSTLASVILPAGKKDHIFESIDPASPGNPVLANARHFVRVRTIQTSNGKPLESAESKASWVTAPLKPIVTKVDSEVADLKVTWTNVENSVKNSPETRYSLVWYREGAPVVSLPPVAYSFPAKVGVGTDFLLPNTTYQIRVTVLPMDGSSYPLVEESTTAVTLANIPTVTPEDKDIFQSSVTVRWEAPGNPLITDYRVDLATSNSFAEDITTTFILKGSSCSFTGLVPNRGHYVRVAAMNHAKVWTAPSPSRLYQTKPVPPSHLEFLKPVSDTKASLTLMWDRNGNDGSTNFDANQPPSSVWDSPSPETHRIFGGLTPNTSYTFRVRARAIDSNVDHFAISSATVYTRAQPAPPFEYGNVTDFDTWQFKIHPGANEPFKTKYAIQLKAVGSPTPNYDGQFLKVVSGLKVAPSSVKDIGDPSVWRTLTQWGLPDSAGRYVVEGDNLPNSNHKLLIYVRNGDGDTEIPSERLIEPQAGTPQVELPIPGGVLTAAQSWTAPVYVNNRIIPFRASGSSHFNLLMSPRLSDMDVLKEEFREKSKGWSGIHDDSAYCSDEDVNVNPSYDGALKGVCVPEEDLYYLHILGDKMIASAPSEPVFVGEPSFRVFVDTTPPQSGSIQAEASGLLIPDDGDTKGLTKITFSWPVIDGGKAVSRSPIVGWVYSLALNNSSIEPPKEISSLFVATTSVTLRIEDAIGGEGVLPSTGTYIFKVRGVDKAGNWQTDPSVFTYNFKEDSFPPSFKGVTIGGAKMPKEGFRYAAVPVNVPIQLNFSEPMNFSPGLGGIQFVQTHNANGRLTAPRVVRFDSHAEDRGGSTAMMVEREGGVTLEPGSRYEIHSSSSNLYDLGGNRLPPDQKFDIVFFTQMDPSVKNVFETEDGHARVEVNAGALGTKPSGVAFDGNVKNDPMKVGEMVRRASGLVSRRSGGAFNQVLDTVEYNQFGTDGTLFHSPFLGPVTLKFKFRDDNGDGIEDRSEPGHPIKVEKLAIYGLDEETGVWLRMPGSRVDVGMKEVAVDLRHFSAYALMGAGDFDLTDAHVFPVPFRAKKDSLITFVFPHAQMATVKIYTLDGKLVKTLSDDKGTGFVKWDPVVNENGDPVGSDVYLYIIENDQQRKVGKLMVIR